MAEFDFTKVDKIVQLNEQYDNTLFLEGFSAMMDNPSYSYKFFWLEGIVQVIAEGKTEATYEEVIDKMILNAWFAVTEYHIHLTGYYMGEARDNLERAVLALERLSGLDSRALPEEIRNALSLFRNNREILENKKALTHNVPYKALSGFANRKETRIDIGSSEGRMLAYYNKINGSEILLPYTFGEGSLLQRKIIFSTQWMKMIQDNMVLILGWIQHEKLKWLQGINPEVPGLVYKLAPTDEKTRKLNNVHRLWDSILDCQPIQDVFTDEPIQKGQYDVDHFIPRSFVMNDELWDLMPMDSSLNSAKNNRLPQWDVYFVRFASNQYFMYKMKQQNEKIRSIFESCYKDNMYSIWAAQDLYRDGNSRDEFFTILERNMKPAYDSARRQGYKLWII